MTRILAIANEKGGVAKTTTAISLGGVLVKRGQDVLLIDLDPQANLTLALGISPHEVRQSTADLLLHSQPPIGISRETIIQGLDIIPSNSEMGLAERFLPIRQDYKKILQQALSPVQMYDTIILDCPPSLGVITQNALAAADFLIVPTQVEYFSVYSLRNVMSLIKSIRENDNPKLTYRILITMLDIRIGSHNTLEKQLRSTFKNAVFNTAIQIDSKLRESGIAGLPITHYSPRSRSVEQYKALAMELPQYVSTEKVAQPAGRSI